MQFPRLTSVALGIGIIALSAMGTIAWREVASQWRAQVQPGSCGNWVLDSGESCEVGVCCPGGQVCNIQTCICEVPAS